jgi:DNA-binding response OmpR family regulator
MRGQPRILMRTAGYEVESVGTAREALAAAGLCPPQAVILDLDLRTAPVRRSFASCARGARRQ